MLPVAQVASITGVYGLSGLLALASFINFSPVLFLQYFVWFTPFFPLAASEAFPGSETVPAVPAAERVGAAIPGVGGHGVPDRA